jgi:hypothetical protein
MAVIVSKIVLTVVSLLMVIAIIRSLVSGKVEWSLGEAFGSSRSDEPWSYWFTLIVEIATLIFVVWLVFR